MGVERPRRATIKNKHQMPNLTPMQWPSEWRDQAQLELIKSTAVNFLIVDGGEEFGAISRGAKSMGVTVGSATDLPAGVRVVKGDWPGVRLSANGDDTASAGPTGEPWVNMNGWRVAIENALSGHSTCWINAGPKENAVLNAASYRTALPRE